MASTIHFDCESDQINVTGSVAEDAAYDILPYRIFRLDRLRQISSLSNRFSNGHSYRQRNSTIPGYGRTILRRVPPVH